MKKNIHMVATPEYPTPKMVVHHNQKEDFTLYQNAGFAMRWYAFTIDIALFTPLFFIVQAPFKNTLEYLAAFGYAGKLHGLTLLLLIVPYLIYFILPTLFYGRTLGKKIVGLRVVRVNCAEHLELWQVVVRETVGKMLTVLTLMVGFIMVVFNGRKRALHDYMADTVVIMYRER